MQLMDDPPSPQMIYDYRRRWGLSQEEAGKRIGSSRQAWQKWENGERHMPKPVQYLLWLMERVPKSGKPWSASIARISNSWHLTTELRNWTLRRLCRCFCAIGRK